MPHTAFRLLEVVDKFPLRIESLAVWGNKLLVGTAEGVLLVMGPEGNSGKERYNVLDSKKAFAKKPITQIDAVGRAGSGTEALLSLSDALYVHSLPSFTLVCQLPKTRGCSLYTLAPRSSELLLSGDENEEIWLAAAQKRKLVMFSVLPSELGVGENGGFGELCPDLALPDAPRSAVFSGGVGADTVCVAFKKDYHLINSSSGAVTELFPVGREGKAASLVLPRSELLLSQDNLGIFIGSDGTPTRKNGITWPDSVESMVLAFPYVVAASSQQIEIQGLATMSRCQSHPVKGCTMLAASKEHAGCDAPIFVGSSSQIYRLSPAPLLEQLEELQGQASYDEALALCRQASKLPDAALPAPRGDLLRREKQIYSEHGRYFFRQQQFERAFECFESAAVHPCVPMALFPQLVWQTAGPMMDAYKAAVGEDLSAPSDTAPLAANAEFMGLLTITSYLEAMKDRAGWAREAESKRRMVDTAILKCYVLTKKSANLQEHVATPPPKCLCDVAECERFLQQQNKTMECACLLRAHGEHRKALQLLRQVSVTSGAEGGHDDASSANPTVAYLQQLGAEQTPLICEFSQWVLEDDEAAGLAIFTGEGMKQRRAENRTLLGVGIDDGLSDSDSDISSISSDGDGEAGGGGGMGGGGRSGRPALETQTVLQHLQKQGEQLVLPYLEFVVAQGDETQALHDRLLLLYLKEVESGDGLSDAPLRKRLLSFIQSSRSYTPEKILSNSAFAGGASAEALLEERAVLLSRLRQHSKALHIYVHKLKDEEKARVYCRDNYSSSGSAEDEAVYLELLKVYLQPPEPETNRPDVEAALRVLNEHTGCIDCVAALSLLPPTTPMSEIGTFLQSAIRLTTSKSRDRQVVKNIMKAESLQVIKARGEAFYVAAHQAIEQGLDQADTDPQKALQNFEKAAKCFARAYGEGGMLTKEARAMALYCTAAMYKNQRDMRSASSYAERCVEAMQDVVSEDHPAAKAARRLLDQLTY